jgi:hypothetical protein
VEGGRRVKVSAACLTALSLVVASAAHAQYCEGVFTPVYVPMPELTLQVGEIVGTGPVNFLWRTPPECPATLPDCVRRLGDPAGCKPGQHRCSGDKQFLLPGDLLAIVSTINGHVCTEAPVAPDDARAAGWIAVERVKIDATAGGRPPAWWFGNWRSRNGHIDLWLENGELHAKGDAWYRSASMHFAGIDGVMTIEPGGLLYASESGCDVRLAAFGEQIVAVDNGRCGGGNASMGGFYTRNRVARK